MAKLQVVITILEPSDRFPVCFVLGVLLDYQILLPSFFGCGQLTLKHATYYVARQLTWGYIEHQMSAHSLGNFSKRKFSSSESLVD